MGRRKIYDREGWMSRIKIKLHGLDSKKRTLLKLDEDLLEMSERIAGEGIGSFDYTSQKENIEESFLGMEVLKTYIEDVDKKFEEINEAFKKSVSKNAVEELSKIKMEDFKVANNLGIKNYQTVSSPMTGERRIEYDKKEIGLSDFMGIYEDRVGSYVEEFALVFEEQYKGAETEDVRDYLREYYKAGEFDYKMYQPEKQMWSDVADIVSLGILPLGEALFGWNPITGESLTDTERGSKMLEGIVSLIPVGAAIKTVGKGGKLLLKTTAKLYVSECVTGLSMYGANYAGEKAGLPPELQAVLTFTAGATVAKISSDALFKPGGVGIIDDVATGASGAEKFNNNDDAYEYYMNLVDNLDASTERNTATFYSGKGNRELAEEFAKTNGKTTLEMTLGGKCLDDLKLFEDGSPLTKEQATDIWKRLSERYAENASGTAFGFTEGAWEGSIFNTIEFPALEKNPNIDNVIIELFKKGGGE